MAKKRDLVQRLLRRGDRLSIEAAKLIRRLRALLRRRHSERVRLAMFRARAREGRVAGGLRQHGRDLHDEAMQHAAALAPIMATVAHLSARAAARELTARNVALPSGEHGAWHGAQVIRVRDRLRRLLAAPTSP
jgi:hypothetical protein